MWVKDLNQPVNNQIGNEQWKLIILIWLDMYKLPIELQLIIGNLRATLDFIILLICRSFVLQSVLKP